jgi:hypothetical protein
MTSFHAGDDDDSHLDLSGRDIAALDFSACRWSGDERQRFACVRSLDLSRNNLKDAPVDFIRTLPQLARLDLAQNQITSFAAFPRLATLRVLSLRGNRLLSLAVCRSATRPLPCCEQLDVAYNSLSSLRGVECLTALVALDASHNIIRFAEDVAPLSLLPRLRSACLAGNPVAHLSDASSLSTISSADSSSAVSASSAVAEPLPPPPQQAAPSATTSLSFECSATGKVHATLDDETSESVGEGDEDPDRRGIVVSPRDAVKLLAFERAANEQLQRELASLRNLVSRSRQAAGDGAARARELAAEAALLRSRTAELERCLAAERLAKATLRRQHEEAAARADVEHRRAMDALEAEVEELRAELAEAGARRRQHR